MRIAIVGTGYVGLVSGACFAEFGTDVVCVDTDADKIDALARGIVPIFEPGLEALVARQIAAGRLRFTTDLAEAMSGAAVVMIAVGTPESRRGDGAADTAYVHGAAREIAKQIHRYIVVVDKSTVPVGTARDVRRIIKECNPDADFDVCANPEFLREGAAINDFMRPDRVVIGVETARAEAVMRELYRPLYLNETPMVVTSLETAEIIKYAANAFLATKITFINEIANLCEKAGADVQHVAHALGLDGRIGSKFLHAGPGYGGSCFPKDTRALVQIGKDYDAPQRIVETVAHINAARREAMTDKIVSALGGDVRGKKIAVLGVSFKPNTDDIREAPALGIIDALQKAGADIAAHDPAAMDNAKKILPDVRWAGDPYEAAQDADALVIVTEWNEYRALSLPRLSDMMKRKCVIDLRNVYKPDEMRACGFHYVSIGRPDLLPDVTHSLRQVT